MLHRDFVSGFLCRKALNGHLLAITAFLKRKSIDCILIYNKSICLEYDLFKIYPDCIKMVESFVRIILICMMPFGPVIPAGLHV